MARVPWRRRLAAPRSSAIAALLLLCLMLVGRGLRTAIVSAQSAQNARRVWSGVGIDRSGSPSFDGRYLSYTDPGTGDLGILDLATGASRRLTNTGGWSATMEGNSTSSVLSPDGRQVAYVWVSAKSGYEVRVLPVDAGAQPRSIMAIRDATHFLELAGWTDDGRQLLVIHMSNDRTSRIALISVENGSLRPLKSLGHHYPRKVSLSHDARHIAYDMPARNNGLDVFVMAADGSADRAVVANAGEDSGPIWSPDDSRLVFYSNRTGTGALWTLPLKEGKPAGEAQLLQKDAGQVSLLGMTRNGTLYYFSGGPRRNVQIAELDENLRAVGSPLRASKRFADATVTASWSPDGESLAYYAVRGDQAGSMSLVIRSTSAATEREVPLQLRAGPNEGSAPPRWFPDGRSVLVAALDEQSQPPRTGYYRVNVSDGTATLLHSSWSVDFLARNPDLSADGKVLYYSQSVNTSYLRSWNIFRLDLETRQTTNLREWMPDKLVYSVALSRDGSLLAYLALDDTRGGSLEVIPSAGGPARQVVRLTPWYGLSTFSTLGWSADDSHLYFAWSARGEVSDMELYRVSVSGGLPQKVGISLNGQFQHPQLHPGGRRLAFSTHEQGTSEIWALDNILPSAATRR